MTTPSVTQTLVNMLEEAYHRQAWHGTNLRGSVRGLSLDRICWRPSPHRHNIWEIVVHCAYWKYTIRRRLTGEKRGSFPLHGSNWFRRPVERTTAAWEADLRLLESMHRMLITTIGELSDKELTKKVATKKFTHLQTIQGIAMHDVYHAGQIQLLKRLRQK